MRPFFSYEKRPNPRGCDRKATPHLGAVRGSAGDVGPLRERLTGQNRRRSVLRAWGRPHPYTS